MAFESRYWRKRIHQDISLIKNKLLIKTRDLDSDKIDEVFSFIEIKLFLITYSLRKLMDTRKFPDFVGGKDLKILKYNRNSKKPYRPWGMFEDYYDLSNNYKFKLSFREVCNQFTHAEVFQPVSNNRGYVRYLFFVSDRDKNKHLYRISILYFLNEIEKIIDLYPKSILTQFDHKSNKYLIIVK